MGFGWLFSRQSAIKQFLMALEEVDLDLLGNFASVRDFLKEHIKSEASKAESRKVISQLVKDGVEPKVTAYLFIRVLLEDLLLDGHYHVLPGRLNRDGESFLAIYNNVVRELRRMEWFNAAQAETHFQEMRNGIAYASPSVRELKNSA